MKKSLLLILSLISTTLFANVEDLVGKYALKGANTYAWESATVKKVLVAQATLFEPAKYEYKLDLNGKLDGLYLEDAVLDVSEDGTILSLETDIECDDPGCNYLSEVTVEIKRSHRGKAYIVVEYYGANMGGDGESDGYEIEGKEVFFKID